MKKKLCFMILMICVAVIYISGCSKGEQPLPSDDEIMANLSSYLTNADFQDPTTYASLNEFLSANLGLDDQDVSDVTLYLGAPKQNTTFFLMLTKTENADSNRIKEKLERTMDAHIETSKQGYMTGYTEYDMIEKGNKVFVIMHEDSEKYAEMQEYLYSL